MRLVWVVIPLILIVSMIGIVGMHESFATSCSLYSPKALFTSEKVTIIEVIDEKPINKKIKTGISSPIWGEHTILLTEQYTLQPLKSYKGDRTQAFVYEGGPGDWFANYNKGDIALIFEHLNNEGELTFGFCSSIKLGNGENVYEYSQNRYLIPLEHFINNQDKVLKNYPWFSQVMKWFENNSLGGYNINLVMEYLLDEDDFYFLSQYFDSSLNYPKMIVDLHLKNFTTSEYSYLDNKRDVIHVGKDSEFPLYSYNMTRYASMYDLKRFAEYDSVKKIDVKSIHAFSIDNPPNSKITMEKPINSKFFSDEKNASLVWKINISNEQSNSESIRNDLLESVYIQKLGVSGTQYVKTIQNYCINSSAIKVNCNIEDISSKTITLFDKSIVLHKIKSNVYSNDSTLNQITILIGLLNEKETWMIKGEYPLVGVPNMNTKINHNEFAEIADSMKIRNYEYDWYSNFNN